MSYTLLDLRSRVRAKIKDTAYSADTVDGFINDAINEIADLYPWVWFQKVTSNALTPDSATHAQQSDHHITTRLVLIDPDDSTRFWDITPYRKSSDDFFSMYPAPENVDSAQPGSWTEYGDLIYFNCPSDDNYTLKQFYQKLPDELTADDDVPELPSNFREAIVLGAAYRCEEERQNFDIAAVLQNRFNDRVSDLIMRFANDTLAGPDTVLLQATEKYY